MKLLKGMFCEENDPNQTSQMRVVTFLMSLAGIYVTTYGFLFKDKDAFDIMMIGGMLIGSGLTGKLWQKSMERGK